MATLFGNDTFGPRALYEKFSRLLPKQARKARETAVIFRPGAAPSRERVPRTDPKHDPESALSGTRTRNYFGPTFFDSTPTQCAGALLPQREVGFSTTADRLPRGASKSIQWLRRYSKIFTQNPRNADFSQTAKLAGVGGGPRTSPPPWRTSLGGSMEN